MLEIYVDADACPVKAETLKVAERHGLAVHIVSNGGLRPSPHPLVETVVVGAGPDVADDWIAEHIGARDIAITADIPLASRCLQKQARVLKPNGEALTPDNIGMALAGRELSRHLREVSGNQTFHAEFSAKDRSRFLNALENVIQSAKKLG